MVDSNGKRYYLHYDQIGSLRYITDRNVNIVKSISYDSFGNITSQTNGNLDIVFGFAGGLHDRDTNLVHFGFREYDPFTGNKTAKDPILFAGEDTNLYGYVLGDPVGLVDPEGKLAVIEGLIGGLIGGAVVGIVDAILNANCWEERINIFLFDVSTGAISGFFATGGGVLATIFGEVGGMSLNALTAMNGVPKVTPCNEDKSCK